MIIVILILIWYCILLDENGAIDEIRFDAITNKCTIQLIADKILLVFKNEQKHQMLM